MRKHKLYCTELNTGEKRALALDLELVILCDLNQEISDGSASEQVGTSIQCQLLVYHGFRDSVTQKQKHLSMISVGSIPGLADQWASLQCTTSPSSYLGFSQAEHPCCQSSVPSGAVQTKTVLSHDAVSLFVWNCLSNSGCNMSSERSSVLLVSVEAPWWFPLVIPGILWNSSIKGMLQTGRSGRSIHFLEQIQDFMEYHI